MTNQKKSTFYDWEEKKEKESVALLLLAPLLTQSNLEPIQLSSYFSSLRLLLNTHVHLITILFFSHIMIVFPKYVKLIKLYVKCLHKEFRNESTQVVLFQKHGSSYLRPSNSIHTKLWENKNSKYFKEKYMNIHILS